MPIHQLQLPSSQAFTPDITPQLSQLVSSINKGQERQTLADLGCVDKVSDPEADGCEIDEAEIAFGGFVISGRQAA
jgi:hypothetical protein